MATERIPLGFEYSGSTPTGLREMPVGEATPISHGGHGGVTAVEGRSNMGHRLGGLNARHIYRPPVQDQGMHFRPPGGILLDAGEGPYLIAHYDHPGSGNPYTNSLKSGNTLYNVLGTPQNASGYVASEDLQLYGQYIPKTWLSRGARVRYIFTGSYTTAASSTSGMQMQFRFDPTPTSKTTFASDTKNILHSVHMGGQTDRRFFMYVDIISTDDDEQLLISEIRYQTSNIGLTTSGTSGAWTTATRELAETGIGDFYFDHRHPFSVNTITISGGTPAVTSGTYQIQRKKDANTLQLFDSIHGADSTGVTWTLGSQTLWHHKIVTVENTAWLTTANAYRIRCGIGKTLGYTGADMFDVDHYEIWYIQGSVKA